MTRTCSFPPNRMAGAVRVRFALAAAAALLLGACQTLPQAAPPPGADSALLPSAAEQATAAQEGVGTTAPVQQQTRASAAAQTAQQSAAGPQTAAATAALSGNPRAASVRRALPSPAPAASATATAAAVSAASAVGPLGNGHHNHHFGGPCPACTPADFPHLPDPGVAYSAWEEQQKPLLFRDEYICDGGDQPLAVQFGRGNDIYGLQQEDTVIRFRDEDGAEKIKATNKVCIYAPRFAAIRRVSGLLQHRQHVAHGDAIHRLIPNQNSETRIASTTIQPLRPQSQDGAAKAYSANNRQQTVTYRGNVALLEWSTKLMPYEDLALVRTGGFLGSEKVRLATSLQHAASWILDEAAQVVIDTMPATEYSGDVRLQGVHLYKLPKGKARLRVCKLASKDNALPGEFVDFTLRYDNVGDQVLKNVTLVDSLSTRLEYVPDSAKSTREAKLTTAENDGESLILRWDLEQPLEVGKGGVIRFRCRVR